MVGDVKKGPPATFPLRSCALFSKFDKVRCGIDEMA